MLISVLVFSCHSSHEVLERDLSGHWASGESTEADTPDLTAVQMLLCNSAYQPQKIRMLVCFSVSVLFAYIYF